MSASEVKATRTFKCSRPGCNGLVAGVPTMSVPLRTSCHAFTRAYPCVECGLLHFGEGQPAKNRGGLSPFFVDTVNPHVIVLKDDAGVEQARHAIGL